MHRRLILFIAALLGIPALAQARPQKDPAAAYRHARFTEPWEGAELHGRRLGRLRRKLEQR